VRVHFGPKTSSGERLRQRFLNEGGINLFGRFRRNMEAVTTPNAMKASPAKALRTKTIRPPVFRPIASAIAAKTPASAAAPMLTAFDKDAA
jgi:hypothetical protein